MYDKKHAGALILQHRNNAGLTQEQFAEVIGLSAKHFSEIERGKDSMSMKAMLTLCSMMGVTPDQLLGFKTPTLPDDMAPMVATLKRFTPSQRKHILRMFISLLNPVDTDEADEQVNENE